MSAELKQYIYDALSKGSDKETVRTTLIQAGWSASIVGKLLDQISGVDAKGLPIPAPRNKAHHLARDLFFYVLIFITLSFTTFGVGGLLFNQIDRWFPDSLNYYSSSREVLRNSANWAIAQSMISAPLFFWFSQLISRGIQLNPEKRDAMVRKLMIYLILTITSLTALTDIIIALTSFLSGELTSRFIGKALVVFGIALLIFIYYFYEVRQDDRLIRSESLESSLAGKDRDGHMTKPLPFIGSLPNVLGAITILAIVLSVVSGFMETGGPEEQRARHMDSIRVQRLQNLRWRIADYQRDHHRLPVTLSELLDQSNTTDMSAVQDPETKTPFEFKNLPEQDGQIRYELCAIFSRPTQDPNHSATVYPESDYTYTPDPFSNSLFEKHPAGRVCRIGATKKETK